MKQNSVLEICTHCAIQAAFVSSNLIKKIRHNQFTIIYPMVIILLRFLIQFKKCQKSKFFLKKTIVNIYCKLYPN